MDKRKGTRDIWFATFLKSRGFEIVDFEVISKDRGRYFFNISDEDWKTQRLEFDKSEVQNMKQIQCSLKDMLY